MRFTVNTMTEVTRYEPGTRTELFTVLEGQLTGTRVAPDADTGIVAATVADLLALQNWPKGMVISIPRQRTSGMIIKISKAHP